MNGGKWPERHLWPKNNNQLRKSPPGYTIVEVLIVLAVSGLMFLIAANFISGKQEKNAFTAGINQFASQIQDVVEEVNDGKYSDANFTCSAGGGTLSFNATPATGSNSQQGRNSPCVFLGKVMYFSRFGAPDTDRYAVFSLAGIRGKNPITNRLPDDSDIQSALPTVINDGGHIYGSDHCPVNSCIDLTVVKQIAQGLEVVSVTGTPHPTRAIGFIQSVGTPTSDISGSGTLQAYTTGSQPLHMVYVEGMSGTGLFEATSISDINSRSAGVGLATTDKATLCVTDGTQYAYISIGDQGGTGSQLVATVKRLGTNACT